MPRYKVKGRYLPYGTYDVPSEVLDLVVDIGRIDQALATLQKINECNITSNLTSEDREFARRMKMVTVRQVEAWKRYSELKLREHLAK
jgi:hypothetical protein